MRGAKGLTLVEMLVVVALLAAGATLAAPAFRDLLRDTRRAAALTALSHALHAARTAAASSGRRRTGLPSSRNRCSVRVRRNLTMGLR